MVDDTRQASIDACLGLRNDVYPCREDVPTELWGKKIDKGSDFNITKWQDNSDGSASVEFDCSDEMKNFLAGQGLLRVLELMMKAEKQKFTPFKEGDTDVGSSS